MFTLTKQIITTLLCLLILVSCKTKTKTKTECSSFKDPEIRGKDKKNSKYEVIILKDGKRITGTKSKKGKSKLFKKKVLK